MITSKMNKILSCLNVDMVTMVTVFENGLEEELIPHVRYVSKWLILSCWLLMTVTYSSRLGDRYISSKKHLWSSLFQLYFSKKYVFATNDFAMHLIISKWLRIQKCRQKRKTMRQRGRSKRRNCQKKILNSFNYVIDHSSICFFFDVNSLHCFEWFLSYYLLHFLSSYHFAALTSL